MAVPFLTPIGIASRGSNPSTATEGDIYYNTGSKELRYYNGTTWVAVGSSGGGSSVTVITEATTDTNVPNGVFFYDTDETSISTGITKAVADGNYANRVTTTTDNAIARFDGTGGLLQNSGVTVDDTSRVFASSFLTSGSNVSTYFAAVGSPGYWAELQFATNTNVLRWRIGKNPDSESGSNAGSNLSISRYSDAGSLIDTPVSITRSTGLVTINNRLTVSTSDTSEKVIELQQGASATAGHLYSKGAGYLGWIGTRADSTRRFAYESNGGRDSGSNFGLYLYDSAGTNVKTVWDATYVNSSSPTNMNITASATFNNGLTVSGTVTLPSTTTIGAKTWIAPTLLNSWVNYGQVFNEAGYFKDANGVVHIRGLVKNGTGTIFTLPSGYCPTAQHIFLQTCNPNVWARVDVTTGGDVFVSAYGTNGTNGWVSLDGITFATF